MTSRSFARSGFSLQALAVVPSLLPWRLKLAREKGRGSDRGSGKAARGEFASLLQPQKPVVPSKGLLRLLTERES